MTINEQAVFKKLKTLENSQESIETLAFWILHHRDAFEIICSVWLSAFRTATDKHRMALLNLANDVCQKARRKRFTQLRDGFGSRLPETTSYLRHDENQKAAFLRLIAIWEERDTFEKTLLDQLRTSLNMTFDDSASDVDEKLLLDFEPASLVHDLQKYQQCEESIERARQLLNMAQFDFGTKIRSLKDRQEGVNVLKDVDETCRKMSDFVSALEEQVQQHHRLISLLEQARSFFGQQLRDATVVEDAYRKFGSGIQNVKDQLEEMQRTGVYLGMSPPRDAPSPTAGDDPFAQGVEQAIKESKKPGNRDVIESLDMELDEEEKLAVPNVAVTDDMNLKANQSFMQNRGSNQIMGNLQFNRKIDPRIERMQQQQTARKFEGDGVRPPLGSVASWNGAPGRMPLTNLPPPPGPWSPAPSSAPPRFGPPGGFGMPPPPFVDFSVPPPRPFPGPASPDNVSNLPSPGKGPNRRNLTVLSGGH